MDTVDAPPRRSMFLSRFGVSSGMSGVERLRSVDGLRGVLAVVVVVSHIAGYGFMRAAALIAVMTFFGLSGYVLTRSWDGRFAVFLARRFARLWPLYALCTLIGFALAREAPDFLELFWLRPLEYTHPLADPPAWSLLIEAQAMIFMPFIVWTTRGKISVLVGAVAFAIFVRLDSRFAFGGFFILGSYCSRWDFRSRIFDAKLPQWLGKISYSLYLTHYLVLIVAWRLFGAVGGVVALPIVFMVAWAVWRAVERPSIMLSRRIGRRSRSRLDDAGDDERAHAAITSG